MTVFVILNANEPTKIETALSIKFPGNHLKISSTEWLVAAAGQTAKDIADQLGISEGNSGSAIVFTIAGYWGRAANNVWEWLVAKMAQTSRSWQTNDQRFLLGFQILRLRSSIQ